jgi:hypothetical protein
VSIFKAMDKDHNDDVEAEELRNAFIGMKIDVTASQAKAIFDSMDLDGNGSVSLPELQTDYNNFISKDLALLLSENSHLNEKDGHTALTTGAGGVGQSDQYDF